ncbi:hypothetical protein [Ammoniphilus sp. 3BR4]
MISQKIIKEHQGTLQIESKVREGTKVDTAPCRRSKEEGTAPVS